MIANNAWYPGPVDGIHNGALEAAFGWVSAETRQSLRRLYIDNMGDVDNFLAALSRHPMVPADMFARIRSNLTRDRYLSLAITTGNFKAYCEKMVQWLDVRKLFVLAHRRNRDNPLCYMATLPKEVLRMITVPVLSALWPGLIYLGGEYLEHFLATPGCCKLYARMLACMPGQYHHHPAVSCYLTYAFGRGKRALEEQQAEYATGREKKFRYPPFTKD